MYPKLQSQTWCTLSHTQLSRDSVWFSVKPKINPQLIHANVHSCIFTAYKSVNQCVYECVSKCVFVWIGAIGAVLHVGDLDNNLRIIAVFGEAMG